MAQQGDTAEVRAARPRNAPTHFVPEGWHAYPSREPRAMLYGKEPKTAGVRPDAPAVELEPEEIFKSLVFTKLT